MIFACKSPSRWKLRTAIKRLNEVFNALKLKKHPDKSEIGHVEKGFDFLGYHYLLSGLSVAQVTLGRFSVKFARLDEQRADRKARERYWRQFTHWIFSGVKSLPSVIAWHKAVEKGLNSYTRSTLGLNYQAFISVSLTDSSSLS